MNTPVSAPDDAMLRNFRLGTLPDDELAVVLQWMEENPELAEQRLAAIHARDTVVNAIDHRDTSPQKGVPVTGGTSLPDEIGGYRILGELGRGGMGVVVEAENKLTRRRVAIKLIVPQYASDEHIRERFLREARAVAKIDHPNVVPILHVGEDNRLLYIVMPLLKGETLAARLARDKQIPPDELMRITCEMAAGLAAAHGAGLIHRDIKPANIWLDADTGRARILDFGLVKPLSSGTDGLTETGAVMGTVFYMSPEQAEGKPVDTRSDLFSLGAVLYHAATGEVPFKGDSKLAVLVAVKADTPPRPEKLNPELPSELTELILSLLEKRPADRPDSATEVITELQGSEQATPHRAQSKSQPTRRRNRAAIAAVALLLVCGAVFAVYQIEFTAKEGTLVVEVSDTEADVRFQKGELRIYDTNGNLKYTLGPSERNAKLPAGEYRVTVLGADGVALDTPEFTMKKDGKVALRVTARLASVINADRRAAEYVLSIGGTVRVNDSGADIKSPADLPEEPFRLTTVTLGGNRKVTDAGLAVFKGCVSVRGLGLADTAVTDTGLANLDDCKGLIDLDLNQTNVTDAGLAHFKGCKNLTGIRLYRCGRVSDAGLAHFKDCKELVVVNLHGTQVSDAGLRHLKGCKRLETLNLENTQITDAGLIHLTGCDILSKIYMSGTKASGAGVPTLTSLKRLTLLGLNRTQFTAKGIAELQTALPQCALDWNETRIEPKK